MEEKEIFIHVGMPKSSSTFLQHNFFNKLEDVYFAFDDELTKLFSKIASKNSMLIDTSLERDIIKKFLLTIGKKKIVISSEGLVGGMFDSFKYFENISRLMKEIFPNAKIILILRRQDSIIESLYKQFLHEGNSKTFNGFFYISYGLHPTQINIYRA